jgi:hypothetical protein
VTAATLTPAAQELWRLYQATGALTPAQVVEAATDPASPLHDHFEWDDSEAARRYRLVQAGRLIRRCRVTIEVGEEEVRRVRAFVSVPTPERPVFVATDDALADPDRRDVVLTQARRDLAALRRKYSDLLDWKQLLEDEVAEMKDAA